jgi:hypothetical protein
MQDRWFQTDAQPATDDSRLCAGCRGKIRHREFVYGRGDDVFHNRPEDCIAATVAQGLQQLEEMTAKHDARVTELLNANNAEVEKRRRAQELLDAAIDYSTGLVKELKASTARARRLQEALVFVEQFFNRIEDGTAPNDPLYALRKSFHAPVRKAIDDALASGR